MPKLERLISRTVSRIIMPEIRGPVKGPSGAYAQPVRVTIDSLLDRRKAVYEMAWQFKMEMHYDFTQYSWRKRDEEPDHVAFLWQHPEALQAKWTVEMLTACVGGCCFRRRPGYEEFGAGWGLQWVWLHPYHRRCGLLYKAWPAFKAEFGEFIPEPPVSDAMRGFLNEVGWPAGVEAMWRARRDRPLLPHQPRI